MSLLVETIRVLDGVIQNLQFHNSRLNKSRKELFQKFDTLDLADYIQIPPEIVKGVYKCRVIYGSQPEEITFDAYQPRTIKTLRVIENNTITYNHKYTDRQELNHLFGSRGHCDDILIIKNGFVTDTSYSNIVFFDGSQWVTPSTYLLNGTMRSFLLTNKIITERHIVLSDLTKYSKARLINSMLPFATSKDIEINNLVY